MKAPIYGYEATSRPRAESNHMDAMKYWGFLAAKVAAVAGIAYLLLLALYRFFPVPHSLIYFGQEPFSHDLAWTLAMLIYSLVCLGLLYLAILDQRYRCRSCLRRLRMPVATGSWTNTLLFGPPRTEYICLYGHGTLRVPELQIAGSESPNWDAHQDMWRELEALEEARK